MSTPTENRQFAHWRAFWRNAWLMGFVVVLSAIVALLSLTMPFFMLLLFDRVINARSLETLWSLSILAVFALVSMGVFDYARKRILARFAARLQEELEPHLVQTGTRLGPRAARGLGTAEIDALRAFVHSGGVLTILDVLWIPIFVLAVFLLNATLGTLAIAGCITLVVIHAIGQGFSHYRWLISGQSSGRSQAIQKNLRQAQETLRGQRFGEVATRSYITARARSRNAAILARDVSVAFQSVNTTLRLIFSILALGFSASLVLQNQLTAGGMIASIVLLSKIFAPLMGFLQVLPGLVQAVKNWRKIGAALSDLPQTGVNPQNKKLPAISLSDVTVTDDIEGNVVFRDLNLEVLPGKVTQIIGGAGTGKTLLADVLSGARPLQTGRVTAYGVPFSALEASAFDQLIGYVPELPNFFEGTIAANISGLEVHKATDQVREAATIAGLDAMIMALPKNYETRINESGAPLPRGMRDLLALARAIYRTPAVVIVDEPSDALVQVFAQAQAEGIDAYLQQGGAIVLLARTGFDMGDASRAFTIEGASLSPQRLDETVVLKLPVTTRGIS